MPQYWVEDTHEAIIPLEIYQKVQAEKMRRRKLGAHGNASLHTTCFTSKIRCSCCNKNFRRRTYKRVADKAIVWACRTKDECGSKACSNERIPEASLFQACCEVLDITNFDETLFYQKVELIEAIPDHVLLFHMADGTRVETTWEKQRRKELKTWQRK